MEIPQLNETVQAPIRIARSLAKEYGNEHFSASHLLSAILKKEAGLHSLINYLGADIAYMKEWAEVRMEDYPKGNVSEITGDESITRILEEADKIRATLGILEIDPLCLLCALSKPGIGFTADELKSFPLREKDILSVALQKTEIQEDVIQLGLHPDVPVSQSAVMNYCINKNKVAKDSMNHPVTGREKEMRAIFEVLGRYCRPNVILTGEAGVGKTAIVEGIANQLISGKTPPFLEGATLYELDMGKVIAGATYKGEIEERLSNIIKGIRKEEKAILFIDDIHVLLEEKNGNSGAANILKQELSKGGLTVIGITTSDQYRKLIEPDYAFSRRFEEIHIAEPDTDTAIKIIENVYSRYKEHHKITATQSALFACVHLAKRYIKDRKLPDSAIDLLDRTMSSVKLINETGQDILKELQQEASEIKKSIAAPEEKANKLATLTMSIQQKLSPILLGLLSDKCIHTENPKKLPELLDKELARIEKLIKNKGLSISENEIAIMIAAKTGIPVGKIQSGEKEKLITLEDTLRQRVVGQDNALKVLSEAILESRSGMNKPNQPIGSFFFLGPTGTGKTELAKALAEALFNDEKAMIRFDMSEFKEAHSAALLYGAPPGYVGYEEGGLLVNKIRRQPYAVVLFDEIEKAHPSIYDTFLQIMDEGKLHDRLGKEGDFSNAVILFTSNIGSEWLMEQQQSGKRPTSFELLELMGRYFRPEFLARISEIVPFSPINQEMLLKIFNIQFQFFEKLLSKQGIEITLTDEAKNLLANKGFVAQYGARQIVGTIRNYLAKPVSKLIISGDITSGSCIHVGVKDGKDLIWECTQKSNES